MKIRRIFLVPVCLCLCAPGAWAQERTSEPARDTRDTREATVEPSGTNVLQQAARDFDKAVLQADLNKVSSKLAQFLDVKPKVVRQALIKEQKKPSDLAMAKLMAMHERKDVSEVLKQKPESSWTDAALQAGVDPRKAEDYLRKLERETTFYVLEHTEVLKRKNPAGGALKEDRVPVRAPEEKLGRNPEK